MASGKLNQLQFIFLTKTALGPCVFQRAPWVWVGCIYIYSVATPYKEFLGFQSIKPSSPNSVYMHIYILFEAKAFFLPSFLTHSFVRSSVRSSIHPSIHHSIVRSFIHSINHSFIHSDSNGFLRLCVCITKITCWIFEYRGHCMLHLIPRVRKEHGLTPWTSLCSEWRKP
jgi:hypothetical protein